MFHSLYKAADGFLVIIVLLVSFNVYSDDEPIDLFSLTLEELMELKVDTGNLVKKSIKNSPSAITVITQEQILTTPARNLIDLLESYVPGLLVTQNGSTGPTLVIRGMGMRHFQTLLLVNGKPVNQKSFQGSMVELRNWDMGDIQKVEVVRGPGSVTHGPGAITGVINIITKQAVNHMGLRSSVGYNHGYDSKSVNVSYGTEISNANVFMYASVVDTVGSDNYRIFQAKSNGIFGYKGGDVFDDLDDNPLQAYYGDYKGDPQVKLYLDIDFSEQWRFWSRYNNSGQLKTSTQRELQGRMQDRRMFQSRYYIFTLENSQVIADSLKIDSQLSFDSEDYLDTAERDTSLAPTHPLNRRYGFSEDELYFRSTLNYQATESLSLAGAVEWSYDTISAPWGESANSFLARAGGQAFISENSIYQGDGSGGTIRPSRVAKLTNGWSTNTYSLATEINYLFTSDLSAIISGRIDKNDQTDYMISPRIAFVYQASDRNTIKASWQRSLRMNTMMELYWLEINDRTDEADPEQSTTYEISFHRQHSEHLYFAITGYHNESEIFSWNGSNLNLLGVIKAYGIEPEISYRTDSFSFGINHSFFELIDWDFKLKQSDGSATQFISYSDMLYKRDYLTQTSTGNSLNDWANQHTKLWFDYKINDNWLIHVDARIIWQYEYGNDLYAIYENAYADVDTNTLSANELMEYNDNKALLVAVKQTVQDKDIYGKDIRLNASLTWQVFGSESTQLILYGQNLVDFTSNKRQKRNFTSNVLPVSGWIEEPRAIGLKLTHEF